MLVGEDYHTISVLDYLPSMRESAFLVLAGPFNESVFAKFSHYDFTA